MSRSQDWNISKQYDDEDINSLLTIFVRENGGFVRESSSLLSSRFRDQSDSNDYYIVLTGAVDHAGKGTSVTHFLDKTRQPAPERADRDDRRDIFDDLLPQIRGLEEAHVKIVFPFNILQHHWLAAEIRLHIYNKTELFVECYCHDPCGGGRFHDMNFVEIRLAIEKKLSETGYLVKEIYNKESPYSQRQADGDIDSCGVIGVDDTEKLILGQPLTISYDRGAILLRQKHFEVARTLLIDTKWKTRFLQQMVTAFSATATVFTEREMERRKRGLERKEKVEAADDILEELATLDLGTELSDVVVKSETRDSKKLLAENIRKIREHLTQQNYSEVSRLIKANLQLCHDTFNKGKYLREEYDLFSSLAEIYNHRGDLRDYPKALAIYQYLKVLVTKLDPAIQAALNQEIVKKEQQLEKKFVGNHFDAKANLERIELHKERLRAFRDEIKDYLVGIEYLGIPEDKDAELDEDELLQRAEAVECIYRKIQDYFIGEEGLFKQLIADSIEKLGGVPEVRKRDGTIGKLEYAFFGMGSMALCTMTPWSDYEGGILIEEGLSTEDEARAKEFLRKVTVLVQMKLIHFGETILSSVAIEELNDFGIGEVVDDWFYDDTMPRGLSSDGQMPKACKNPLGRQGFKKFRDFELIGRTDELLAFQRDDEWFRNDKQLVQALWNIELISGSRELIINYRTNLLQYREKIQQRAFEILKEDVASFDPQKQVFSEEDKDGQLFNTKKEIYRFPDRIIVALKICLINIGTIAWHIKQSSIGKSSQILITNHTHLYKVLAIATELRLRTYANNNSQRENLSILSRHESEIKELQDTKLLSEVFHLKDLRVLHRYYYTVLSLAAAMSDASIKQIEMFFSSIYFFDNRSLIKGYVYKRFMQYYAAIHEFEKNSALHEVIKHTLAKLYLKVGRYEEAYKIFTGLLDNRNSSEIEENQLAVVILSNNIGNTLQSLGKYDEAIRYYQKALEIRRVYQGGYIEISGYLNNIGMTLQSLGKYNEALRYIKEALKVNRRMHKGDHTDIASFLNNIGNIFQLLGRYEEAIKFCQDALEMNKRIYPGDNQPIARSLNSIGITLESLGKYNEALKYKNAALEMNRRIYPMDHSDIVSSLNTTGNTLQSLGKYNEALQYRQEALEMSRRIYRGDHADIAVSLHNIGTTLESLGKYNEAIKYKKEALEIKKRIYPVDHSDIAVSINAIGVTLELLGKYGEALKYKKEALEMQRRIYSDDHTDIAVSLNNMGSVLQLLGKYDESIKFYQEALEMRRRIYKGDHASIALSLCNMGAILGSLDKYDEALKYQQEALEMNRRIYPIDHPSIISFLNNIGVTFQYLGRYDKAIEHYREALEIIKRVYKKGNHPTIKKVVNNIGRCTLFLANKNMLLGNYKVALAEYRSVGLEVNQLIHIANIFLDQQDLQLAISCYEVIEKIVLPNDIGIKHNLACYYHNMAWSYHNIALNRKSQTLQQKFVEYLEKSGAMFEKALAISNVRVNLYTEYAMFLIRNHNLSNIDESTKIQLLLQKAIEVGEDGTCLSYCEADKLTVVEPIQELLKKQKQVAVKLPTILSHYLLITLYSIHGKRGEATSVLEELAAITTSLEGQEDYELSSYLFEHASKELEGNIKSEIPTDKLLQSVSVIQRSWRRYIENQRSTLKQEQVLH